MRVVVVVPGCLTTQEVRARRLTRLVRTLDLTRAVGLAFSVFALALLMIAGRSGGLLTTCTAPPPRTAPPQVQAHNFAKAIFTDISRTLFPSLGETADDVAKHPCCHRAIADRCKGLV